MPPSASPYHCNGRGSAREAAHRCVYPFDRKQLHVVSSQNPFHHFAVHIR